MAYLTSTLRARLQSQITAKEAQLAALNASYTAALENVEVSGYKLETGEGAQSASRRKPEEIYRSIRSLEADLDRLYRRLEGTGVVNFNLRRRSYVR